MTVHTAHAASHVTIRTEIVSRHLKLGTDEFSHTKMAQHHCIQQEKSHMTFRTELSHDIRYLEVINQHTQKWFSTTASNKRKILIALSPHNMKW